MYVDLAGEYEVKSIEIIYTCRAQVSFCGNHFQVCFYAGTILQIDNIVHFFSQGHILFERQVRGQVALIGCQCLLVLCAERTLQISNVPIDPFERPLLLPDVR